MAATDLFADGSLHAQWTVETGAAVEEDASGRASLLLSIETTPIDPIGAPQGIRAAVAAGDFDIVVCLRWGEITNGSTWAGISVADLANALGCSFIFSKSEIGARYVDNTSLAFGAMNNCSRYRGREHFVLRLKRVGTDVTWYYMLRSGDTQQEPGGWDVFHGPAADPLAGAAGYLRIGGRTTGTPYDEIEVLAVYMSGPPAAAAAPTAGLAISSPMALDADLGVAFVWAVPAANISRTLEVQTAADSGFTASIRRLLCDFRSDGDSPSVRRGGCALGQTIYARARYVDELGQVGSWSGTVSAVATSIVVVAGGGGGGGGGGGPVQVFASIPWVGARFIDVDSSEILTEDGPFEERAVNVMPLLPRVYVWPHGLEKEAANLQQVFFRARALASEAFYIEDPWQSQRFDVEVGPGDAVVTAFYLPRVLTADEYRGFPIPGTVRASVGGVARGVLAVDVDNRVVTLAGAAPGVGVSVKITYREYRLVRITSRHEWEATDPGFWMLQGLELREVFRNL